MDQITGRARTLQNMSRLDRSELEGSQRPSHQGRTEVWGRANQVLRVDFADGLDKYTIELPNAFGYPDASSIYWTSQLSPLLEQFLDDLVSKAVERGQTPTLDGHGLLGFLKVLGGVADRLDMWFQLDAELGGKR